MQDWTKLLQGEPVSDLAHHLRDEGDLEMQTATNETITILYREQFCDGLVCYTIKVGQYNHEEHVRIRDGKANGCTCKNKVKFDQCPHQEALVKIEAAYQSH